MFSSMVTGAADRFDTHFFGAYWLPAFVAVIGSIGVVVGRVGPGSAGAGVTDRNSVQQTLIALILIVSITMLAFMLQALRLPMVRLYAGATFSRDVAAAPVDDRSGTASGAGPAADRARAGCRGGAPRRPTRFGRVLAAAAEHPRTVYGMDGVIWWARLMPLLPSDFRKLLSAAQAPTMAMLNLSAVLAVLGVGGSLVLAFGQQVRVAVAVLAAGLILSRLSYAAAVSQVSEFARLIRVAFDLYRHDIISQLGMTCPADLPSERAMWQRLTNELVAGAGLPPHQTPAPPAAAADPARNDAA